MRYAVSKYAYLRDVLGGYEDLSRRDLSIYVASWRQVVAQLSCPS
jgi:hypothetical protein